MARTRSNSPFQYNNNNNNSRKPLSPFYGASGNRSDSMYSKGGYGNRSQIGFPLSDELISEPVDSVARSNGTSVTIRFRPLSERESQRGDEISWYADGDKLVRNKYNPVTSYAFDRVFGPSAVTQEVYEVAARPVVKNAMEGVNGTVFAYGVTSSGKTHTIHGNHHSPGIIPLAVKDAFSIIHDTPGREFLLRVSYLEIYNEVINDLLDPTGQNLRVREDAQGTYVEGMKEEIVLSPGHALSFIVAAEEHRHVHSNNFNLLSSRSHTIFTLMIESSAHGDEDDRVIFSQLNLIDLAGSESSKTETTALRRKGESYIDKSLLTLGTVIGKLSEGKASHVPYRDSKLTHLLQPSLSGPRHVSLICTVTPASSIMEETYDTLKFASRAKRVEIYASRNKIIDGKSLKTLLKYQKERSVLKQELDQLRKRMLVGVNPDEILSLKQKLEEGQEKMQSCLKEEQEAKAAALKSRIQILTKLILVSSKNTIPEFSDVFHQRSFSVNEDDNNYLLLHGGNRNDSPTEISYELIHRRNSSNLSAAAADEEEEAGLQFGFSSQVEETGNEKVIRKSKLSKEQRERIRFGNVIRKKDFASFKRINGTLVNIVGGLELHSNVFSLKEQRKIVDFVFELEEKGKNGKLKARTYTAPNKWMRGKGRVTIQFGCCYNYATDSNGNPPGILHNMLVDPIPPLFKLIIKRLITWHILPPTCVPDSCIVNIYDEGDCIPPHIDSLDFLRPFCTVSFLSECNILFGENVIIEGPGEFSGPFSLPLPMGSVLVLNGNGADVAKHCVPAVPTKRISLTFRKMDESKWPIGFVPEPDLQGLEPLLYESDKPKGNSILSKPCQPSRQTVGGIDANIYKPSQQLYGQADKRDNTMENSKGLLGPQTRFNGESQTRRQQGRSPGFQKKARLKY